MCKQVTFWLTWLQVPEKFVILSARTLYFGICSSMSENISTSSASVLQRSVICNERIFFIILGLWCIMTMTSREKWESQDYRKGQWRLPVTVEASLNCLEINVEERPDGKPMLCFSRVAFTVGENIDENRS